MKRIVRIAAAIAVALHVSATASLAVVASTGVTTNNGTIAVNSNVTDFLANGQSVSCSSSTGKILVDTTAGTLAWCNGSTAKQSAFGDDSGNALTLNTGSGTDGTRGIIITDNTVGSGDPVAPSSGSTLLHTEAGNLFVLPYGGTSPGTPLIPQVKVSTSDQTPITTIVDITSLTGFSIKANRKYVFEASMVVVASAGTADPSIYITLSGGTGYTLSVQVSCVLQTNAATSGYQITTTGVAQTCIIGAAQTLNVHIFGYIKAPTTDQTFKLQAAAAGAGNLTINGGAIARLSEFQ